MLVDVQVRKEAIKFPPHLRFIKCSPMCLSLFLGKKFLVVFMHMIERVMLFVMNENNWYLVTAMCIGNLDNWCTVIVVKYSYTFDYSLG